MSLYRIKQFYWSIICRIDLKDKEFISKYLNMDEKSLFNKLATYEQKHSINVAEAVMKVCGENNINNEALVKAALLHDIGKIYKKLNPIEKSLMVMLNSISKGKLRQYNRFKKVDVYYNHGDKGYNMLKNTGNYNERFLYLVKNHHNNFIVGDKELDILRTCDNKN
jgi:putative nucleotidyltransferase with HDIG domain